MGMRGMSGKDRERRKEKEVEKGLTQIMKYVQGHQGKDEIST